MPTVVTSQPMPSTPPPSYNEVTNVDPPAYNHEEVTIPLAESVTEAITSQPLSDVANTFTEVPMEELNPENPEEQEERRHRRQQAEDCCCDDDFDEDDSECVVWLCRIFFGPCKMCGRACGECTDDCCTGCADCLHNCCESGNADTAAGATDIGCCGGDGDCCDCSGGDGDCCGDGGGSSSDCDCDCCGD